MPGPSRCRSSGTSCRWTCRRRRASARWRRVLLFRLHHRSAAAMSASRRRRRLPSPATSTDDFGSSSIPPRAPIWVGRDECRPLPRRAAFVSDASTTNVVRTAEGSSGEPGRSRGRRSRNSSGSGSSTTPSTPSRCVERRMRPAAEPEGDVVGAVGAAVDDQVAGAARPLPTGSPASSCSAGIARARASRRPGAHVHEPGAVDSRLGHAAQRYGAPSRVRACSTGSAARGSSHDGSGRPSERRHARPARVGIGGADARPAVAARPRPGAARRERLCYALCVVAGSARNGREPAREHVFV